MDGNDHFELTMDIKKRQDLKPYQIVPCCME